MDSLDAIIIGTGIGGLVTGAILSEKEGWKILVLEKEDVIGGKCYTFEHFDGDEKTFRHRLFQNARSKLLVSDPPLSELIERKIFSNYIFEGGYHAILGGDRSRVSFLASALGAELKIHNSKGVLVSGDGQWHDLGYLMRNWTPEEVEEGKRIAREMNMMSVEECSVLDHIDLSSYLKSRTRSENIINFHEWVAGYSVGLNDPALVSVGEYVKAGIMVQCAGRNFQNGGAGQPLGGFNVMSRLFAEIIEKNRGTIRTGAPVEEIIVEDYQAVGVKTPDGIIQAPRIICNVPVQRAFSLLADEFLPHEFEKQIRRTQPLSGIHGWINLKRQLHPDLEGIYLVPVLPGCKASEGFCGDVFFGYEDVTTYDHSRAPEGEGLICFFAGLLPKDPDEIHDERLREKVIKGIFTFFQDQYPGLDKEINWYMIHAGEELYSVSTTPGMVGNRMLPNTHPLVHNLYFAGDSVSQWGLGVTGAVGGAVNCASAASGKDYSLLLPFYMR